MVRTEEIAAVQPNLHNGTTDLPLHLDFPMHEGFGKVIVTVAVRGSGIILLLDDGDEGETPMSWKFHVEEGAAYAISGNARNLCCHGVLADGTDRESLNLRYGLHTEKEAEQEILRHWPD